MTSTTPVNPTAPVPAARVLDKGVQRAGWLAMTRRMIGSVTTRGRLLAMGGVALFGIVIAVVVERSNTGFDGTEQTMYLAQFGLAIFVPLVSLVIASATLGNLREERTLAYFWLRPIGRWQITVAAYVASLVVLLPMVLIPMLILSSLVGDGDDIRGLLVGSLIGAVGYAAVFMLLGLLTERALVWGLAYILVWEGFLAALSDTGGRLALRTYSTSALSQITDVADLVATPVALSTAIIVTVVLVVACIGVTTRRLTTMDID